MEKEIKDFTEYNFKSGIKRCSLFYRRKMHNNFHTIGKRKYEETKNEKKNTAGKVQS